MGHKQSNSAIGGTLFRWYPDQKFGLVSLGFDSTIGEISVDIKHFQGPAPDKEVVEQATNKSLRDRKVSVIIAKNKKHGKHWAKFWWLA